MGPKKRDKVPIRRSHSSFKYMIPLGTTEQYENMKQAIKRRVEGKGYPHELKRLKQEEEEEKKRKKEKGEGGEGEDGKGGRGEKEGEGGDKKEDVHPTLSQKYNDEEVAKVEGEIVSLKNSKKDLFWLLKQVIQVEAKRKREAKKTITEGGPKPGTGGGGMGMGGRAGLGMGMGMGMGGGVPPQGPPQGGGLK